MRRGVALTREQRTELWRHFDTRATEQESPYERAAQLLFEAERAGVAAIFAEVAPADAGAIARAAADDDPIVREALRRISERYTPGGEYYQAWLARYTALITETVSVAGSEIAADLGLSFSIEAPRVREAIRDRGLSLATNVTTTTRMQITAAVETGLAAGMGTRQVAKLIQETTFGAITGKRATTIARTESAGALNEGKHLAALESGVMRSKEWLTQGDARVRDSHVALDGQRVAITAPFSNGLQHPGDRSGPPEEVIQCRCTQLYYDEVAS